MTFIESSYCNCKNKLKVSYCFFCGQHRRRKSMYPDKQKLKSLGRASLAKFWNQLLILSDQAVVIGEE